VHDENDYERRLEIERQRSNRPNLGKPFTITREELWFLLAVNMKHGYVPTKEGGKSYFTWNDDLFSAIHDLCDRKENEGR
jgi:hypothetical protein